MNHKLERINSEIQRVVSNALYENTRDNLMKTVTITDAKVSSDLSYADMYFTSIARKSHEDMEKELNEAAPYLRKFVATGMDLRKTPILRFHYDTSLEYASKIDEIISDIHEEEKDN